MPDQLNLNKMIEIRQMQNETRQSIRSIVLFSNVHVYARVPVTVGTLVVPDAQLFDCKQIIR